MHAEIRHLHINTFSNNQNNHLKAPCKCEVKFDQAYKTPTPSCLACWGLNAATLERCFSFCALEHASRQWSQVTCVTYWGSLQTPDTLLNTPQVWTHTQTYNTLLIFPTCWNLIYAHTCTHTHTHYHTQPQTNCSAWHSNIITNVHLCEINMLHCLFLEKENPSFLITNYKSQYPIPLSHTHTHTHTYLFRDETRLKGIIVGPHASVATIGVGFLCGGFNWVLQ